MDDNELMSLRDAARYAGVSKSLVLRAAWERNLKTIAVSGRYITSRQWVDKWRANVRRPGRPYKSQESEE